MLRFMVSMEEAFAERLDAFAASRGMSRSAVIRQAAQEYLDAAEKLPALRALMSGLAMQTGAVLGGSISKDQYTAALDDLQMQVEDLVKKPKK